MCYDRMNKAAADKCRFFFLRLCTKILYVLCHVYGMHMCLCVRVCWGVSERARTSVINFSIYVILSLSSAITKSKGSRAIMCCHYKNFSTNTFAPTHRHIDKSDLSAVKSRGIRDKTKPQTKNTRLILLMVTHSLALGSLVFQICLYKAQTSSSFFVFHHWRKQHAF